LLLRASGVTQNRTYDLNSVTGAVQDDGGVPHGRLLVEFAEAVLGEDEEALARARATIREAIGPAGLADAAGVVGLFDAIDRSPTQPGSRSKRRKRQPAPTSARRSLSTVSTSPPAADQITRPAVLTPIRHLLTGRMSSP